MAWLACIKSQLLVAGLLCAGCPACASPDLQVGTWGTRVGAAGPAATALAPAPPRAAEATRRLPVCQGPSLAIECRKRLCAAPAGRCEPCMGLSCVVAHAPGCTLLLSAALSRRADSK